MKHKGVTLIELIVALSMAAIIMAACFSIYKQNLDKMNAINNEIDSRANVRIAMDFLCDRIKAAKSITPGRNSIKIDYDTIYIRNDILRAVDDAQQIACGIVFMEVEAVNADGLMKVIVKSNMEKATTFVCKRK
jgi:prepilin-type N-terminal cleavage/methylation domain-containing protein